MSMNLLRNSARRTEEKVDMGVLDDRIAITGESQEQAFDRYMKMWRSNGWLNANFQERMKLIRLFREGRI